jgi:MOSC domain protein
MGEVMGICISKKRGTAKVEVEEANLIEDFGIEHDAHAGNWHRQVSLLSFETREAFKARGAEIDDGAFGENIIVSGIDLIHLPVGTQIKSGDVLLEITQIGKECHSHCEIYHRMGECIMPTNGIFTRVLHGGKLKKGDQIKVCTE